MTHNEIPAGYRMNAQGHLVPEATIKPLDLERDALVMDIVEKAKALQVALCDFKQRAMGDVDAFIELAAEKYDAKVGGNKGNVTLSSFDGRYKLLVAMSDRISFGAEIQAAKALIDECIRSWTQGSRAEIRALVEHAFQTDREGKINTGRILGLMRLNIDDPTWAQAMEAIRDSIQVTATKAYLRLYERKDSAKSFDQIPLDLAAL